jgi:hypothetical protein
MKTQWYAVNLKGNIQGNRMQDGFEFGAVSGFHDGCSGGRTPNLFVGGNRMIGMAVRNHSSVNTPLRIQVEVSRLEIQTLGRFFDG